MCDSLAAPLVGQDGGVDEVPRYRRPPMAWLALEAPRAGAEMALLGASLPLLARAPKGDGHPVLVLPGFIAGDDSTRPLRRFLRSRGYYVHGWRLGRNLGPSDKVVNGLEQRVRAIADRHGRKMSIVGWSLGGVYAREIGRSAPEVVRSVITLGSPFNLTERSQSNAAALFEIHNPDLERVVPERPPEWARPRMPVPTTAIYTRTDAVVPWRSCVEPPGPHHESVEVRGSHCGLGHNPEVLRIVADRLARPDGAWAPYQARRRRPQAVG
jgi:pimeloyl-ACP methyl ester carboxylesterase